MGRVMLIHKHHHQQHTGGRRWAAQHAAGSCSVAAALAVLGAESQLTDTFIRTTSSQTLKQ